MARRPRGEQFWDVSGHRDHPAPRSYSRSSATGSGCRWNRVSGLHVRHQPAPPSTRPGQAHRPRLSDGRTAGDSRRRGRGPIFHYPSVAGSSHRFRALTGADPDLRRPVAIDNAVSWEYSSSSSSACWAATSGSRCPAKESTASSSTVKVIVSAAAPWIRCVGRTGLLPAATAAQRANAAVRIELEGDHPVPACR